MPLIRPEDIEKLRELFGRKKKVPAKGKNPEVRDASLDEWCEPCEWLGDKTPTDYVKGWDATPVCEWHYDNGVHLRNPERVAEDGS